MAYATVTLTGTYQTPDQTPHKGHVEIIPSERVIKDTTGDIILTGRVKVDLDAQGAFTVELPATDDPTLNPTGFGYTIAAKLHSSHPPAVSFSLPASLGATTVEDLTPVDPATFEPTTTYAESSTVTALDTRVTTLETTPTVTSYNDLTDTPDIPATPADLGAEPAGLSQTTNDALAATYATTGHATLAGFTIPGTRTTGGVLVGAANQTIANTGHNAFPGLAVRTDGNLLTVWRSAPQHDPSPTPGVIKARVLNPDGTPNGAEYTVLTDTLDLRDPMLTRLTDGRLVMQFFKHDGNPSGDTLGGVWTATSTDNGATFTTPTKVPFTWDKAVQSSSPIVVTPSGEWLAVAYGRTSATYRQIRLMRSTDEGQTWDGEVTVAEGQAESRNYMEPFIGYLPDGVTLMCLIRVADAAGTNPTIYRTTSTDDGATWTAESPVITPASGRPAWISLTSGAVVATYRAVGSGNPLMVATSYDNGATWTTGKQLGPTPTAQSTYAQLVEAAPGLVAAAYSVEDNPASSATLRLGYLGDGYGFSPLGDDFATTGLSAIGCRLRYSTGNPTIPDNTLAALPFSTEEADTHGFHSTTTNTTRVTIPPGMGGYYRLTGNVMFAANATGRRQVRIAKGGVLGGAQIAIEDVPANASGETTLNVAADLVPLNDGDYVELYAYQASGAALAIKYEATTLTATRVGRL